MTALLLAPAAFLAGVLMFLAPCTLPIVPGYLAFIAGVPGGEARGGARWRIIQNAAAFCIGFSIIFVLFGTFAAFLGSHLGIWRYDLARFGGVLLIFFGLMMAGLLNVPMLAGERRMRVPSWLRIGAPQSSALLGALFALGWSPCIGPILGSILFVASMRSTALEGALLLCIFSLGLALPLMILAVFIERVGAGLVRFAGLSAALQKAGGVILIVLGILMLGNWMGLLVTWGYGAFGGFGYDHLLQYL